MTESEQLAWGSHLPALMACVASTTGPIIELGIGHFSTPVLHAISMATNREVISVEDNAEWAARFEWCHLGKHRVIHSDYDSVYVQGVKWSVAFIDNSPGGERRRKDFERFIGISEFVLVHDYHRENESEIKPVLRDQRCNYFVHRWSDPPTLVASMSKSIIHMFGPGFE